MWRHICTGARSWVWVRDGEACAYCPATEETKIKTEVEREGQRFVDSPVFATVSRPAPMAVSVASALGGHIPQEISILDRFERTRLRWLSRGQLGGRA